MAAVPTIAIDLPLKALVWQADEGAVWIGYNTPDYLAKRHSLPAKFVPALAAVEGLVAAAAQ